VDAGGAAITALALSPDGKTLAACFGATILLATVSDCQVIRRFDAMQPINGVAFSPDGARLAAACDDATRVFDVSGGGAASELRSDSGGFYNVAWSLDGKLIAAGHFEPFVAVFDAETSGLMRMLNPNIFSDEGRTCVLFSLDEQLLVSTAYNSVVLWPLSKIVDDRQDVKRPKKLSVRGHAHIIDAAFSPDGAAIAVLARAEGDYALHFWDFGSGRKSGRARPPRYSTCIAWAHGGNSLVAVGAATALRGDGGGVTLWDALTLKQADERLEGADGLDINALAAHHRSGLVVAGAETGEVMSWEIDKDERVSAA